MTSRGAAIGALVGALALVAMLACPAAGADPKPRSERVANDYFGVNYPLQHKDSPEVRRQQLDAIAAAGIKQVRRPIAWRDLQPAEPSGGSTQYSWISVDAEVAELAAHGLRMQPAFLLTPRWAESPAASSNPLPCELGDRPTAGTTRIFDYATAAAALVERYGRGGTFWKEHPDLPRRPITTWEIWNEPNSSAFWCPVPDPATYADMFVAAATAIKYVQRDAKVIVGGLVLGAANRLDLDAYAFLIQAVARQQGLWSIADGVGVHAYPGPALDDQLGIIALWREELREAGVPDREPMYLTEIGWSLSGPTGMSEELRSQRYRFFMRRAPRLNCNLAMVAAHAWTTSPAGGPVWDGDAGIADRDTAKLTASAIAYRETIALMQGRKPREAPHAPIRACHGMPTLDRDEDGVAEHRDYYPLNPRKSKGPAGW